MHYLPNQGKVHHILREIEFSMILKHLNLLWRVHNLLVVDYKRICQEIFLNRIESELQKATLDGLD